MTGDLAGVELRSARADDLRKFDQVWQEADPAEKPLPPGWHSPLVAHEFETGTVTVAERLDRIVGMAATLVRGNIACVAELAVVADLQGRGLGRRLLRAVLPAAVGERCTTSSADPRAHGLYARSGIRPRWPVYALRAERLWPSRLSVSNIAVVEADSDDQALLAWDQRVSGRWRPEDHAFLTRTCAAVPLWFRQGATTVGSGYVQRRAVDAPWHPDDYVIGPIGVKSPELAAACVGAAVEWAEGHRRPIRVSVPGPNRALAPLLDAGFRITHVRTFCSDRDDPAGDPRIYLPAMSELG